MSGNGGKRKSMDDVLSSIKRIIGNDAAEDGAGPRGAAPRGEEGGEGELPPLRLGAEERADTSETGQGAGLSLTPDMRADEAAAARDEAREEREPPLTLGAGDAVPGSAGQAGSKPAGQAEPEPEPASDPAPLPLGGHGGGAAAPRGSGSAPAEPEDDSMVIDEEVLQDMIRRTVRAELEEMRAGEAEDEARLRRIAREEFATALGEDEEVESRLRGLARDEASSMLGEDEAAEGRMRGVVRDELMGETGQNISRNVQQMIRVELERLLRERGL